MEGRLLPSKSHRLYLLLKERITSGGLPPGARLPGEPDLAAMHKVSRITVRRALDALAGEGLIRRQAGAGTFVVGRDGPHLIVSDLANLIAHIHEMGRSTTVKLLGFEYRMPEPDVAQALGLAEGEEVQASVRVRLVDGSAFSHLTAFVPARIGKTYTEGELAAQPLASLLERSGVVVERASQTIGATAAGPDVAEALGVGIGSALLAVTRVVQDRDGRGVEFLRALYRPDRYRFQMELSRKGEGPSRRWSPVETPEAKAAAEAARSTEH